jgi:NAD(P)-dependent dehydrogenase (short-subunit alcohol dehydrogenase family)
MAESNTLTPDAMAGRVAVVTGAAGDIGHAIVQRLLRHGCRVLATDLSAETLQAAYADTDREASARLTLHACDVGDSNAVAQLMAALQTRWGGADMLVNNAAMATATLPVGALDDATWEATLNINLTGAWRMARAVLQTMVPAGRGVILNMSSQLGHVGAAGRGAYGVSKAGLMALTRAIAVDYAPHGIRAVSLSPGAVLTSRVVRRYGGEAQAVATLAPRYPIGRLGTVDEVADAALFLLGDGARFMTGSDLLLDGGYTAV